MLTSLTDQNHMLC